MAKRKLTIQQRRRIASLQKKKIIKEALQEYDGTTLDESSTQTVRVISHHGRELYAEDENLNIFKCKIRQNLGDIACGDSVVIQRIYDTTQSPQEDIEYVVVAIRERSNLLLKTGFAGATKPVAANIGQIIIVTAIMPRPNPYLIDRYLAATENLPATAIIVINKMDLIDDDTTQLIQDFISLYQGIGYRVIQTSMKQQTGIDELAEALANTSSILVGLSGVGKSSIVKAMLPKEDIRIAKTSDASGEGKHTTTVSALYHLNNGGVIIDSPGVRDFTPIVSNELEITNGFIDVRQYAGACKFSNCSHKNEPGCALKQAVLDGELNEQRFNNYLRMLDEFNEKE